MCGHRYGEIIMAKPQYELMQLLFIDGSGAHTLIDPNARYPNGVDSEPCMVGNALHVVKYLLKHELSDYKLVKKTNKACKRS